MPQARFFVDAALAEGDETPLPPEVAHHAVRVLRLREGDAITVFNGTGGEFTAHLSVQGARAWANLERFEPIERESPLAVTLVQSWVATDKLEWIAEKAVELGATAITLVPAARSVVHLDGPRMERRLARLRLLPERAQPPARYHCRDVARARAARCGCPRRTRHRARSSR
jgi:16S rRNA (uracil1498-N3)-methyltransferase